MATTESGHFENRYVCLAPHCLCDVPSKEFIIQHSNEYHNGNQSFQVKHFCLKPNCRYSTSVKIEIRAHLQKYHDIRDPSQSVHLLQVLKRV